MTTSAIRNKLIEYIQNLDDKKVKVFYTLVENDLNSGSVDWSDDFKAEMDRRLNDYKEGNVKMYSWQEVKASITNAKMGK